MFNISGGILYSEYAFNFEMVNATVIADELSNAIINVEQANCVKNLTQSALIINGLLIMGSRLREM